MSCLLLRANAKRSIPLADNSVQCVVTSPPYWGLRDYGEKGQIGLESTPDEFVAIMTRVLREVRRVLRDDGVLWLNLGDSYGGDRGSKSPAPDNKNLSVGSSSPCNHLREFNFRKQRVGIPHQVVFALQADGWYWRDEIVWYKPAPMPESVRDRTTKAHEFVFMLTKSETYFYDQEAIKEPARYAGDIKKLGEKSLSSGQATGMKRKASGNGLVDEILVAQLRNLRSVWTINSFAFPGAHFATMPPELAERCIKAGTSEKGCCPECGTSWARIVEKDRVATRPGNISKVHGATSIHPDSPYHEHAGMICGNRDPKRHTTVTQTVGWEPDCQCNAGGPVPSLVFDPFNGSGTSGSVATGLSRHYIGMDLSAEYLTMAAKRISRPHARLRPDAGKPLPLFDSP